MVINKNDFVEIEFTGKISDTGDIFDTNIKSDAEDADLDLKDLKPFVLSVGHRMLPDGFDADLVGKDVGIFYNVDIAPENAFGKRDPKMIRMIPTKHFHEQKISPVRGMQLNLDGQLVRILSSDRGRTLVDFNNPLAGKKVSYKYKINKIVTEDRDKINALQDFLFKKVFDFNLDGKTIVFKVEKQFEPIIKIFEPKFKEVLGFDVKTEIADDKNSENTK